MNDVETLSYFSQLLLFKQDPSREVAIFPSDLTPVQRRIVHTLSHNMGLCHMSRGQGNDRQVHVFRSQTGANVSPPAQATPISHNNPETNRRGLNRAATTDFSEARAESNNPFGTIRSHNSAFLNVMDSSNGMGNPQNLRAAKSFADLRSFTPSPVPSSASFPAALQSNGARVQHYDGPNSGNSNTPTLTPTPGSSAFGGMPRPQENLLVDSFGTLSLGTGVGGNSLGGNPSPHRLRSMFSWEHQDSQGPVATAPIGSNRAFGMGFDQPQQDRIPMRQPRGPAPERGTGFRRNGHQSRGSDEARVNSGVDIIVE